MIFPYFSVISFASSAVSDRRQIANGHGLVSLGKKKKKGKMKKNTMKK
jgi:hypothetical protein